MLNVLELAKVGELTDDGYVSVRVEPHKIYPPTIAHIMGVLESASPPDGALRQEYDAALALPDEAWDYALAGAETADIDNARELRAQALEIARRWFTEMLHRAVGAPMHLHILRDERYTL